MSAFATQIIHWQRQHGRHDLPWQRADAYRVWLSEIMLQQTQVGTVIPYYLRFLTSFPNIASLAAATEEQVLAHWSGLGYYARGRNLHRAAKIITEKYQGEFPREFEQILDLPGIGRSTAAAICALVFHQRRAILDGNVRRVLARYCGIAGWTGEKKVEEKLWQQAEHLLPPPLRCRYAEDKNLQAGHPLRGRAGEGVEPSISHNSTPILTFPLQEGMNSLIESSKVEVSSDIATYTQALMDMGATICTRSKPKCDICPVQHDCVALATDRIKQLPTPRPRKAVPEKNTTFLLLMHGNDILLEKRASVGIWGGLWCPPQIEDGQGVPDDYVQRSGMVVRERIDLAEFTHTFTHFKLHITPVLLRVERKAMQVQQPGSVWLNVDEALGAAIPAPVRVLLERYCRG